MIYEHQLRSFADILDQTAESAAELAGGARNSEEMLTLSRLHAALGMTVHELRRYALHPVPSAPDPDPEEAA